MLKAQSDLCRHFLWKRASQLNDFLICCAYENENLTN